MDADGKGHINGAESTAAAEKSSSIAGQLVRRLRVYVVAVAVLIPSLPSQDTYLG